MACIFMVFFHSFFHPLLYVILWCLSFSRPASKIKWQMRSLLTANRNNTLQRKKNAIHNAIKKMWARIKTRTKKLKSAIICLRIKTLGTNNNTSDQQNNQEIAYFIFSLPLRLFSIFNINILFSFKPCFIHNSKINNTPFQFNITSNVQIYSIAQYDDWGLNKFQAFGLKYKLMLFIYLFIFGVITNSKCVYAIFTSFGEHKFASRFFSLYLMRFL